MTRYLRIPIVLVISILLLGALAAPAQAAVSFDFFYSNLRPYGSWSVSAQYGRVWRPYDETRGWNPYYDGHWVNADVGWTWVSDYEWGGVPYHYGTWVLDPAFGWVWVPGYVWAPSWVVFRTGPDYIGWAPVSPGFTVGVSFGAPVAGPFVFVSARNFVAPRIRGCVVPEYRSREILRGTRVENTFSVERNVVVNRGPDVRFVERASGRAVRSVPIERVRDVGPTRHVSRDDIAVDRRGGGRELRAASPVMEPRASSPRGGRGESAAPRETRREIEPRRAYSPRQAYEPPPRGGVEAPPRHEPRRVEARPPQNGHGPGDGRPARPQARPEHDQRGERGRPRQQEHHGNGHP